MSIIDRLRSATDRAQHDKDHIIDSLRTSPFVATVIDCVTIAASGSLAYIFLFAKTPIKWIPVYCFTYIALVSIISIFHRYSRGNV